MLSQDMCVCLLWTQDLRKTIAPDMLTYDSMWFEFMSTQTRPKSRVPVYTHHRMFHIAHMIFFLPERAASTLIPNNLVIFAQLCMEGSVPTRAEAHVFQSGRSCDICLINFFRLHYYVKAFLPTHVSR